MILHSIAPHGMLLPQEEPLPEELLVFGSIPLSGRRTAGGFVVSRILSTNPSDYLRADLSPGSVITTNEYSQ